MAPNSPLQNYTLDEVERCPIASTVIVSLIAETDSIHNAFVFGVNDKQYHFAASSKKQQNVWCTTLANLSLH